MNDDPTTFSTVMGMVMHAEAERARQEERAAVVAWLRDVAETMNHNGDKCCGRVEDLADAVARGDHRREEE